MSRGPVSPAEYGGDWTEARLQDEGYATGLDVWDPLTKAYENFLANGEMANAQLWSLRQAIVAAERERLARHVESLSPFEASAYYAEQIRTGGAES